MESSAEAMEGLSFLTGDDAFTLLVNTGEYETIMLVDDIPKMFRRGYCEPSTLDMSKFTIGAFEGKMNLIGTYAYMYTGVLDAPVYTIIPASARSGKYIYKNMVGDPIRINIYDDGRREVALQDFELGDGRVRFVPGTPPPRRRGGGTRKGIRRHSRSRRSRHRT